MPLTFFDFTKKLDSLRELGEEKKRKTGVTECKSKELMLEEQSWPTFFCKTTQHWKSLMRMSQINKMTVFLFVISVLFLLCFFFLWFPQLKVLRNTVVLTRQFQKKSAAWNNFLRKHIFLCDKPNKLNFKHYTSFQTFIVKRIQKIEMCTSPN